MRGKEMNLLKPLNADPEKPPVDTDDGTKSAESRGEDEAPNPEEG